ncbi:hypothetical protein IFM89_036071 [Coptis chinensis]|uniref:Uncharacterized protein n=1 Tax=Coptis chinensis TaxID=261450 RepID=A0A835HZ32_9MAGN|nr:hypothetical protein IFM89_036071 [Coptis chinensis]
MTSVRTKKSNSYTLSQLLKKDSSNTNTLSGTKATIASLFGTPAQKNNCKALILKSDSSKSHFLNFNFLKSKSLHEPLTKVRIKTRKLLVKTAKSVRKKEHQKKATDGSKRSNVRKWNKKVTSLISNTFSTKKSEEESDALGARMVENTYSCDRQDSLLRRSSNISSLMMDRTGEEYGSLRSEIIGSMVLYKTESESSESFRTPSIGNSFNSADQLSISTFSEHPSLKENSIIEEEDVKPIVCSEKSVQQKLCPTCNRPFEPESSIKSFLAKTKTLKFIKDKYGSSRSSNGSSKSVPSSSGRNGKSSRTRILFVRPKAWKPYSLGKKMNTEMKTKEEEVDDKELCKKKILMGEKCRPLNDENGNQK